MAAKNIVKQAQASFTGNIEKAVIEILDERELGKAKKVQVTKPKPRTATSSGISAASASVKGVADAIQKGSLSNKELGKQLLEKQHLTTGKLVKKKRFEVKFNPSQLSFQGIGGGKINKINNAAGGDVDMKYQRMNPRIQMNVRLLFDDCERTEAFMLESPLDPSTMVRSAAVDTISMVTGRKKSVQTQVEGLLGAIRNDYTRKIAFYWGTMKYQGIITNVSAEYTMFATDGSPIRANVHLGILLVDDTITDNNMGQWRTSYEEVFGKDGITNAGSVMQNAGNLLNINL